MVKEKCNHLRDFAGKFQGELTEHKIKDPQLLQVGDILDQTAKQCTEDQALTRSQCSALHTATEEWKKESEKYKVFLYLGRKKGENDRMLKDLDVIYEKDCK